LDPRSSESPNLNLENDYSAIPILAPSFRAVNAIAINNSTIKTPSAHT
jgi:hypothetical protein